MLSMWPPARELHGKRTRAQSTPKGRQTPEGGLRHNWKWVGSGLGWGGFGGQRWQCGVCLRTKRKPRSTLDTTPCSSIPRAFNSFFETGEARGHKLFVCQVVADSSLLIFCSRCGAYAQEQPVNLLDSCNPVLFGHRAVALRRLTQGKHPKKPKLDVSKPWPFVWPGSASEIFAAAEAACDREGKT